MLNKEFMKALDIGFYKEAFALFESIPMQDKGSFLFMHAYETGSIAVYAFTTFLLLQKETAEHHFYAAEVLSSGLTHLNHAYSGALMHARRAAELAPNDISYKEYLLCFYSIPEHLITLNEAKQIALEILQQDPYHTLALKELKNIEKLIQKK